MLKLILPLVFLAPGCADTPQMLLDSVAPCEPHCTVANVQSRIYRSADLGKTWTPVGEGLPEDLQVNFLDTLGEQIVLASDNHGLFISDPEKKIWRPLAPDFLPKERVSALRVDDGVIFAGFFRNGIFASHDGGRNWRPMTNDLKRDANCILKVGNQLWIGAYDGIYALKDGTKSWQQIYVGQSVSRMLKVGENFIASTNWGVFLSKNEGKTWDCVRTTENSGFSLAQIDGKVIGMKFTEVAPLILSLQARTNMRKVEVSDDFGQTWRPVHETVTTSGAVFKMIKAGDIWMSAQSDGIYISKDSGATWEQVFKPTEDIFSDILRVDGVIYAGKSKGRNGC